MNKRGQLLTGFLIIGIVIVVAFGFVLYLNGRQVEKDFETEIISQMELHASSVAFNSYVQNCVELLTKEGLDYYGLKQSSIPLIEYFIRTELPECVDFNAFRELGMKFEIESVSTSVVITAKSVLVDVRYPIVIEKNGATAELREFNYYMKREKGVELSYNEDGTIAEETVVTEDNDAELIIPAGTRVYDANDNLIEKVSINVLDRNFDGMSNDVVLGMIVYEGLPAGARFDPPVILSIKYGDFDLPYGTDESMLSIGYYDEASDLWKSLPSEVDTVNKIITAKIYHFTKLATLVDRCQQEDKYINIPADGSFELVFEQTCGESYNDLTNTEEGSCKEVGVWRDEMVDGEYGVAAYYDADAIESMVNGIKVTEPNLNAPAGQVPNRPCGLMPDLATCENPEDCMPVDWDKDDTMQNDWACTSGAVCSEAIGDCYSLCKKVVEETYGPLLGEHWEKFMSGDGMRDGIKCLCKAQKTDDSPDDAPVYEMVYSIVEMASPATYGYVGGAAPVNAPASAQWGAGGWGYIEFEIPEKGEGCVAVRNDQTDEFVDLWITTDCGEDKCLCDDNPDHLACPSWANYDMEGNFIPYTFSFNPKWFVESPDNPDDIPWYTTRDWTDTEIKSGKNRLYVYVDPMQDDDGCAYGLVNLQIQGRGIQYIRKNPDFVPDSDCAVTVQQRINYLCGCDGSCSGDWDDPQLVELVNFRGLDTDAGNNEWAAKMRADLCNIGKYENENVESSLGVAVLSGDYIIGMYNNPNSQWTYDGGYCEGGWGGQPVCSEILGTADRRTFSNGKGCKCGDTYYGEGDEDYSQYNYCCGRKFVKEPNGDCRNSGPEQDLFCYCPSNECDNSQGKCEYQAEKQTADITVASASSGQDEVRISCSPEICGEVAEPSEGCDNVGETACNEAQTHLMLCLKTLSWQVIGDCTAVSRECRRVGDSYACVDPESTCTERGAERCSNEEPAILERCEGEPLTWQSLIDCPKAALTCAPVNVNGKESYQCINQDSERKTTCCIVNEVCHDYMHITSGEVKICTVDGELGDWVDSTCSEQCDKAGCEEGEFQCFSEAVYNYCEGGEWQFARCDASIENTKCIGAPGRGVNDVCKLQDSEIDCSYISECIDYAVQNQLASCGDDPDPCGIASGCKVCGDNIRCKPADQIPCNGCTPNQHLQRVGIPDELIANPTVLGCLKCNGIVDTMSTSVEDPYLWNWIPWACE